MGERPDDPGEWDPATGSGEPPAALLRRAISHVESLLHRLDPAEVTESAQPAQPALPAPPTLPPARPEPAPPLAAVPADDGTSDTSAQVDAFRKTLRAHEEAHRLRAEASGANAEAAAEGERLLLEARQLSERVRAEARQSVDEMIGIARREAAVLIETARAEAEGLRAAAQAEESRRSNELEERAERDRAVTAASVRELLEEATRDADQILELARERGRAEATKVIDAEVAAAVAAARASVDESRARALDLLTRANTSVRDVRNTLHQVIDSLSDSLVTLDGSASSLERLLVEAGVDAPSDEVPPDTSSATDRAQRRAPQSVWTERERRPLGLLFGAPG